MEKYCSSCGRVFKDSDFKICPYCGSQLKTREGRQPIPRKLRHQIFQRDGYRCVECGATNKETTLHIDHIKPVSRGGTNDINNLQTLCEKCNLAKYTDEWIGGKKGSKNNNLSIQDYKDRRYKRLSKSITQLQLQLLYNKFANVTHSRVKIIQYLVNNYSDYNIKLLLDNLEKEKKDRLFSTLTDAELELLNNELLHISNYSRIEIINGLCEKYSEEEIYKLIAKLEKNKEAKEQLFKRLNDNITDEQLELLNDKVYRGNRSKEEFIRYLCYNYSKGEIYQIISEKEIERAEKENFYKKVSNDLTDNQLKILYWHFTQFNNSKNELISYLCDKYSENQIYSLLEKLQEKYNNRMDKNKLKQSLTPERIELFALLDSSYKDENYQKLVDKLLWIYTGSQIHQILDELDNINNQIVELDKQKDMNGFCILGFENMWYYYYLTPDGEYERFYTFSYQGLKIEASSKNLPWYSKEFQCKISSKEYVVRSLIGDICSKIKINVPTPHERHYPKVKSINVNSKMLREEVVYHLGSLTEYEPPEDLFKSVINPNDLPKTIYCPNCGEIIPKNAIRCKYCKKMMKDLLLMVNNELELYGLNPDEVIIFGNNK